MSTMLDHLGHVYMDWGEESNDFNHYFEALTNYKNSLHISERRKKSKRMSVSYINLANAYMVMFKHGGSKTMLRQSINYSLQGQLLASEGKHRQEWALNTLNLGEANYLLENYTAAIGYYNQSLEEYKRLNRPLWCAAILVDMALAYGKEKKFDKALNLIKEANQIALKYEQVEPYINYKYLSDLYAEKGDYKLAYEAYKKYQDLYNRDVNAQTMLELEGKQLELDNERKDKEIELLNKENKHNIDQHRKDIVIKYALFAFSFLLILVLTLMYNRSRLLKRSKELAEHARKMQQQFLANTSHEIRTPMNGIIGMASQLQHTRLDPDQKSSLEMIKKSAYNLLGIIDDVLDLSKIQAGRIELKEKKFVLDSFLDEIRDLLIGQAMQKDLEFRIDKDDKLPAVLFGDSDRLRQILINLLSNAIKFTLKGSVELRLALDRKSGETVFIKFLVIDTGIGIPSKRTDEVFESFVQLEDQGQRTQGGTGLGLAITKSLVEMQGGKISVKSRVNEGSTFEFVLPYVESNAQDMPEHSTSTGQKTTAERSLEGVSVLVVEDNIVNQQVISMILDRWKANKFIATLAVEAFEVLGERSFDIILMDIELPGINGWQATQYIRTKFGEPVSTIPILALTAYAYDSEREKCLQYGMNDVLTKPYREEELYRKIRELLYGEKYVVPVAKKSNIEDLEARYSDDMEGLKELYELFLREMPIYVGELKALPALDGQAVAKQAHKMKSPVSLFGEADTIDQLRQLNSDKNLDESRRALIIGNVVRDCEKLIGQVGTKLAALKRK
jgi:signal transduction histidine kinase/CheY-like chemotaxis protein